MRAISTYRLLPPSLLPSIHSYHHHSPLLSSSSFTSPQRSWWVPQTSLTTLTPINITHFFAHEAPSLLSLARSRPGGIYQQQTGELIGAYKVASNPQEWDYKYAYNLRRRIQRQTKQAAGDEDEAMSTDSDSRLPTLPKRKDLTSPPLKKSKHKKIRLLPLPPRPRAYQTQASSPIKQGKFKLVPQPTVPVALHRLVHRPWGGREGIDYPW
jgi:hypothetical protein